MTFPRGLILRKLPEQFTHGFQENLSMVFQRLAVEKSEKEFAEKKKAKRKSAKKKTRKNSAKNPVEENPQNN